MKLRLFPKLGTVAILSHSSSSRTWAFLTQQDQHARRYRPITIGSSATRIRLQEQPQHRTFSHPFSMSLSSLTNVHDNDEILPTAPFCNPPIGRSSLRDNNEGNNNFSKYCWRPTVSDVERISWGLPAKVKGTGSRGVPHRLNAEERTLFDLARRKGFLEVTGSAWRSQRRDAPLLNTYRSLCDARGQVAIVLHKVNAVGSRTNSDDTLLDRVVMDLSPLRLSKGALEYVTAKVLEEGYGGHVGRAQVLGDQTDQQDNDVVADDTEADAQHQINEDFPKLQSFSSRSDAVTSRPIFQLSSHCIQWELSRPEAKALVQILASAFGTAENRGNSKAGFSKKPLGVKPGKSRQSGGYGIG